MNNEFVFIEWPGVVSEEDYNDLRTTLGLNKIETEGVLKELKPIDLSEGVGIGKALVVDRVLNKKEREAVVESLLKL